MTPKDTDLAFLSGGGEMGRLMRMHDWSGTPLGSPEQWPQSLRTAVRLMLNSGHPMYIWWGPELACLYNDAYSASIGPERHPSSLGRPGREVWEEIWDIIGPQIDQVMSGRGATWNENALVPITRHGRREDVYWTYSYGPIDDEAAPTGVGGVLVVCNETTDAVTAKKRESEAAHRQRRLFEQAPGFIIIMRGPDHVVEFVNQAHRDVFNSCDWIGRTIRDAFPSIAGQGFYEQMDTVYATGETFHAQVVPISYQRSAESVAETRYLTFIFAPVFDDDGIVTGIFCEGFDVSDVRFANQQSMVLSALGDRIRQITDPDELAYAAAEILGRAFGVSRAGYGTINVSDETITIEKDWNAPRIQSLAGTLAFRDYGSYIDDLKRGETVICTNAEIDPRTADRAEALKAISAQSFINMPVTEEDGFVALLYLNHEKARHWTDEEVALVREVAERTRTAVERRRAEVVVRANESRLRFLADLADEIASASSADQIMAITTKRVGEHLGVSICAYADMDADQDHFTIRGDWCAPGSNSIVGYYSLKDFGALAVDKLHADEPLVVSDHSADLPPEHAKAFLDIGIGATICMPLVKEGRLIALMAIHDRNPRIWTDYEIDLLDQVTERCWAHIERVRAEQEALASAERLRLATESASIGTWDFDPRTGTLRWDDNCRAMFGLPPGADVTYEGAFLAGLHPEDRDAAQAAVEAALSPAKRGHFDVEYRTIGITDGIERTVAATGEAIFEKGQPVRFIGAVVDITARKKAESDLRLLNDTGAQVAAELDLERIVQIVTDAGTRLSGARFGAFFYNVDNQDGESYMLYALSGAPRSAFETYPMPRATAVFQPTFHGTGVVRSDDILSDPRYGKNAPYSGMPEGHLKVRSYLAVPVVSNSGEVLGGLLFGHEEPSRFGPAHETSLLGIAGHAATAIDNARLFKKAERELADRRRAEEALQRLNATLEERVAQEVQERTRVEDHLRQAQKMEAIGQLTGGIAHDFNNMLAVVIGGLNLLQRKIAKGDYNVAPFVEGALDGAQRAAGLTQRLLAFSRQQPLAPKAIDVNRMVSGMFELLARTLGETVKVQTVLADDVWRVEADTGQLESAILNLSVNARDAMPSGGTLTIATSNVVIGETEARKAGLAPGDFVEIQVQDTGEGMSPEVAAKAFDPFYTTKAVGKGTGLGLSQVYGFVRQSGGHVKILSEEGVGTTLIISLPRFSAGEGTDPEEQPAPPIRHGKAQETVMVVEDDDRVRAVSTEALKELGYSVLEFNNPADALSSIEKGCVPSLLFTDIVMPGMSGSDLVAAARHILPGLKVLYTTGYARDAISHDGGAETGLTVLIKPYDIEQLAEKVRLVLDQR